MKVKQYTLVIDKQWEQALIENMLAHVEADEVFQLLDETEVEVCDDCQVYLTSDKEIIMDVFRCPDQQEFCLNCCGCEDHGKAY